MPTIHKRPGDRFHLGHCIDVVIMKIAGGTVKLGIRSDGESSSVVAAACACYNAGRKRRDGYVMYNRGLGHRIVVSGKVGETLHVDAFALEVVDIHDAVATLTWRHRAAEQYLCKSVAQMSA